MWSVNIISLKSDKHIASLNGQDLPENQRTNDLASMLKLHRKSIVALLDKHQISLKRLDVQTSPFGVGEQSFSTRLVTQNGTMSLWLDEKSQGTKKLGTVEAWAPCPVCTEPLTRVVLSPYEPRAAMIVVHRTGRYHLTVPGVTHSVFGAHLEHGFGK